VLGTVEMSMQTSLFLALVPGMEEVERIALDLKFYDARSAPL